MKNILFTILVTFYSLNTSAITLASTPHNRGNACPTDSVVDFAIVIEHVHGTNSSISCKLVKGSEFEGLVVKSDAEFDLTRNSVDYVNCTENTVSVNSLVLLKTGYYEVIDILGNIMCLKTSSISKVIGDVVFSF